MDWEYDVAIIGGGPAGSTVGTLLRRYNPKLRVAILERETFPRDHVGESQLPMITPILNEMGVWEKVEAAGFPIKIGSTYRWGNRADLWNLDFLPDEEFEGSPRPSRFEGQRQKTTFQVDRPLYDKILLDHAKEVGCDVFQGVSVRDVQSEGGRVVGLETIPSKNALGGSVRRCTARHYVDASGESGIIRRAMGVETDSPTSLRNIAIWDYWDDARWADTIGHGGTRAQIMSIGWGWLWFFPISPTRTSIGLVLPAELYKKRGIGLEQTYLQGISEEPRISGLLKQATRKGAVKATKDWSFLADRLVGENWFLAGDSCGFADPILSAGMTLAHVGGRRAAYAILELDRGELDPQWLRRNFDEVHRAHIRHHIRFADFWYSGNGCFSDLKEYCSQIAKDAGIELDADAAFRWLGTGGFANERLGEAAISAFRLTQVKALANRFLTDATWEVAKNNIFRLNLDAASEDVVGGLQEGRIIPLKTYRRNGQVLPMAGLYPFVILLLQSHSDADGFGKALRARIQADPKRFPDRDKAAQLSVEILEALIAQGWVTASLDPTKAVWRAPDFEGSAAHNSSLNAPSHGS